MPTPSKLNHNFCQATKNHPLGKRVAVYECDLAKGHEGQHEDVWQHHSWPDEVPFWKSSKVTAACFVAALILAKVACGCGGAR
jgi:hypothetical protein